MKATDLMIGDWVRINYRNKLAQVTEIVEKAIGTTAISPLSEDEFEPIPLTKEILEKNDFVFVPDVGYKFDDYSGGIVICDIWNHDITVLYNYKVIFNCDYTHFCVHSLQHILRLCMIDKEITL